MKECQKILNYLKNHPDSVPFRKPVDWEAWELHDYPQIIKQPMDLGTIQTNLDSGVYSTPAEFAHDVRLVWRNCMTYNQDGSEFYNLAAKFSNMFEKRFAKIKSADDDETTNPPTLEEKTLFSQNIYKINSEQLGRVVQLLDAGCPKAIEKTSADEIEINIDAIDTKTFRELERFVRECLPQAASKGGRKKKRPSEEQSKSKRQRT